MVFSKGSPWEASRIGHGDTIVALDLRYTHRQENV